MMAVFRAFIALDVGKALDVAAVMQSVKMTGGNMKFVDPSIMHVTLRFLGDTEEELADGIGETMKAAVAGVAPFEVGFKGLGVFPNKNYISVIWVGMDGAGTLEDIAKKMNDGLRQMGFPREDRPFSPHLTLARVKSVKDKAGLWRILDEHKETVFGKLMVNDIILKKSVLTPQGPVYTDARVVKLG